MNTSSVMDYLQNLCSGCFTVGCVMMLDKGGQIVQLTRRTLFGRFYRDNPEMAAVLQIHTTGRQLEMKRGCIPHQEIKNATR